VNAWLLAVVSSDVQAETLPHQRDWATATATEKGWTIRRTFEGVSTGKEGPRKLLRELIAALRSLDPGDRPEWLLMVRADRVGRGRLVESQVVLHEIADLGVRIWTRDAGEIKLDSATDQIIAAVKAGLATLENEVKRDKMNAVYRRRKAAGQVVANRVLYGQRREKDGSVTVVEDQAATVREAFRLRIEGYSYLEIAKRIKPIAAPFRFADGTERTMRWNVDHVREVLAERRYAPAIIDEVTFRRAQRDPAPAREARPQRFHYPLSGAVQCFCGYRMIGSYGGGDSPVRRYECRHHHRKHVNANKLEAQFAEILRRYAENPSILPRRRPAVSPALLDRAHAKASAHLAALDRERDRVWDLFASGKVREDAVQPRLDAIAQKREAVVEESREIETRRAVAAAESGRRAQAGAVLARAAKVYGTAAPADKRAIARTIAAEIGGLVVEEDGTLVIRRIKRQHLGQKPAVGAT
jgi:DNA invertase Pin-like site-specific DNA recombinase